MRKFILPFIFLLTQVSSKAQQLDWLASVQFKLSTSAWGVAIDSQGNSFVAGQFAGSSHSVNQDGIYISKYSPAGNLIWADTSGGTFMATSAGVVVDQQGNAYTSVGIESGGNATIKFGNNIYPGGFMYLLKYNPSGQLQWVVGQGYASTPWAMDIDPQGNVYVTGEWNFGGFSGFITKFDSSGNAVMTIHTNRSHDISLDGAGNIYVSVGPGPDGTKKYSPSGNLLALLPSPAFLDVDSSGNCYQTWYGMLGQFNYISKTNSLGQSQWTVTTPNNAGGSTIFADDKGCVFATGTYCINDSTCGLSLGKYDSTGKQLWFYHLPNPNVFPPLLYRPTGIVSRNNEVFVCGYSKQEDIAKGFVFKITEPGNPVSTSLRQNQNENQFSISPNPSCCTFLLSYKNEESGPLDIKVYDALGKVMYTKYVKNFSGELKESIDLTGFSQGMYVLELSNAKQKEMRKLVVE